MHLMVSLIDSLELWITYYGHYSWPVLTSDNSRREFKLIPFFLYQNDQQRQDITEYKLQLQSQRNMMVARADDSDMASKLKRKNKDLAEAMEELQVMWMKSGGSISYCVTCIGRLKDMDHISIVCRFVCAWLSCSFQHFYIWWEGFTNI